MITLSRTFEFAASHRLNRPEWSDEKNREVFGKCANGHGHNYRMEVTVKGELNPDTSMVIDASELKAIVNEHILSVLDHKDLNNDVPWLEGKLPTVEVVVDTVWEQLAAVFRAKQLSIELHRIKLWETSSIYVTREAG